MSQYEHSRDVISALLDSIHKFFWVCARCTQDGWIELKKLSVQFWKDVVAGSWTQRLGATVAILLILVPSLLQWKDNVQAAFNWLNRSEIIARYAAVLEEDYEREVLQFFQKYHERFMSRDCEWMAEVAADRAMFEKYGNTKYKNYKCEEFFKTEAKWFLAYKINKPVWEDDVVRISGEAVMLLERMTDGNLLMPVKFEIWKQKDWNIWHFSNKPVRIPAKILSE